MKRRSRRHLTLVEVLIAFTLIVLCLFPLMYPFLTMAKTQQIFIEKMKIDQIASSLFVDLTEQLYLKKIPWSVIEEGKSHEVTEAMLQRVGMQEALPYTGSYQFKILKRKPKLDPEKDPPGYIPPYSLFLAEVSFVFVPKNLPRDASDKEKKGKSLVMTYPLFLARELPLRDEVSS